MISLSPRRVNLSKPLIIISFWEMIPKNQVLKFL